MDQTPERRSPIISYSKDSNVTSNMSYSKSKGQSIGSNIFRVQLNF